MRKLEESALKPGDIILTSDTTFLSSKVRLHIQSDISHAMLYVDGFSIIDASGQGVQSGNTQRKLFSDDCAIYVLRTLERLTDDQQKTIIEFVRSQIGTGYAKWEAARVSKTLKYLPRKKAPTRQQFCSRIVAQAYAKAGIMLVENPNFCSPDDLKESPLLQDVPFAIRPATAEEIAFANETNDGTARMSKATNALLKKAREKSKKIENLNDINAHLLEHPHDNLFMSEALNNSGYLDVWQYEYERYSWRYDIQKMKDLPFEEVTKYCQHITSSHDVSDRFLVSRGAYNTYFRSTNLEYFKMMLELYDRLLELDRTRKEVAKAWLAQHRGTQQSDEKILEPHSIAWFETMDAWDQFKAQQTRYVIQQEGTTEVCGICGDTPAKDYRLAPEQRPIGGIDTYRLCDDCLGTRRSQYGDNFEPLSSK